MLVVDASVAVAASHTPLGFSSLGPEPLVAPPLMAVEASSVLHEMAWRRDVVPGRATTMLHRVLRAPIEVRSPPRLVEAAWELADRMGWATQYVALAQMLDCRLVTLDERLIRGIARLGIAVRPREI